MTDKPATGEPTPFEKFAEMTKRLLGVPKGTVDKMAKRRTATGKKRKP